MRGGINTAEGFVALQCAAPYTRLAIKASARSVTSSAESVLVRQGEGAGRGKSVFVCLSPIFTRHVVRDLDHIQTGATQLERHVALLIVFQRAVCVVVQIASDDGGTGYLTPKELDFELFFGPT
jgi:hypothetical protein